VHEPTHRALFSPKSWGKHEPRPADNFIKYTEPEASCLALLTATSGRFEHEAGETPDSTKPDQNPRSRLRAKPHFGDGKDSESGLSSVAHAPHAELGVLSHRPCGWEPAATFWGGSTSQLEEASAQPLMEHGRVTRGAGASLQCTKVHCHQADVTAEPRSESESESESD
jgi:hypothetical protein